MNDNDKLNIFKEYLDLIQTEQIRRFTEFALLKLPEYFWTLKASTTGKNHGKEETLIDHVLGCLYIAKQVNEAQFKDHWTQKQKDQLYSALMLHDGWRCGEPGNERRIDQKLIDQLGLDQDKLGELKTARDHAEVGYKQLLLLVLEFNQKAARENKKVISGKDYSAITRAVRFHYGPWTQGDAKFSLSWNYDNLSIQVHNIDFNQTHNQMYFTRGNVKHTEEVCSTCEKKDSNVSHVNEKCKSCSCESCELYKAKDEK